MYDALLIFSTVSSYKFVHNTAIPSSRWQTLMWTWLWLLVLSLLLLLLSFLLILVIIMVLVIP